MQLNVTEYTLPEKIGFNYDELKNELSERLNHYETIVYGEDEVKSAKSDRASLNKLKDALDTERKNRKKAYLAPFEQFEAQIKELVGMIDKATKCIDTQVKSFEDRAKDEKKEDIKAVWSAREDKPEWLKLEQIWDPKWLNATVSMRSIEVAIDERLDQIRQDIETLGSLPEFGFEATETYKSGLNLNAAISEGKRLAEIQKRKEEAEVARLKAEEEARLRAEEESKATPELDKIKDEVSHETKPELHVLRFEVNVTTDQMRALKQFLEANNIAYKPC